MRGNVVSRVARVGGVLYAEALLARNLEPLHSAQQFCALACKHGSHDEFDATSLAHLRQLVQVLAVLFDDALRLTLEDHGGLLENHVSHGALALRRLDNVMLMAVLGGYLNAVKRVVHLKF